MSLFHLKSECLSKATSALGQEAGEWCTSPFRAVLSSPQPCGSPGHEPSWSSKPDVLGFIFLVLDLKLGCPVWGMNLLLLRMKLWVLSFLPIVKHCTVVGFMASPPCFYVVSILFGQCGGVALQVFRVLFLKKIVPCAAVDSVCPLVEVVS